MAKSIGLKEGLKGWRIWLTPKGETIKHGRYVVSFIEKKEIKKEAQ
jgi:hypothetical protein